MPSLPPLRASRFQALVAVLALVLCTVLCWRAVGQDYGSASTPRAQGDSSPMGPPKTPPPSAPAVPSTVAPRVNPTPSVPATVQFHASPPAAGRWVSLTFDDGPWPGSTLQILKILRDNHIKAVFCMIGSQVADNADLVRAVVADGHELCNHTFTHDEGLPRRAPQTIRSQMQRTIDAVTRVAPQARVQWYRAPGGNWKAPVPQTAASLHMRPLGWTVDTEDWKRPGLSTMMATVNRELGPGAVILMHDGGGNRSQSIALLRQLIPHLVAEGYRFCLPDGR